MLYIYMQHFYRFFYILKIYIQHKKSRNTIIFNLFRKKLITLQTLIQSKIQKSLKYFFLQNAEFKQNTFNILRRPSFKVIFFTKKKKF